MNLIVSLRDIVDAMEFASDEIHSYLNKETGEIVTITDKEINAIYNEDDWNNSPEWQKDMLAMADTVLDSPDYPSLPSQFDIHEYAIVKRFCYSIDDQELSNELTYLIRGSGAFRRFKDAIHNYGIADEWYRFRKEAFEEIAIDWLEKNGIEYSRTEQD